MTRPTVSTDRRMRVANFTDLVLDFEQQLDPGAEELSETIARFRAHADRPYAYVVDSNHSDTVQALLAELRAIRSPCTPYALFLVEGAKVDVNGADIDTIDLEKHDALSIRDAVADYAAARLTFDREKLKVGNTAAPPEQTGVVIIGAGITGLYAASRLVEAGIDCQVLEKGDVIGGIWTHFANSTSQVNTSECGYRLVERNGRSNSDHSFTREILEDIRALATTISRRIYLGSTVEKIEKTEQGYRVDYRRRGEGASIEARGVILAVNDRVGEPREIEYRNRERFGGEIVSGIADGARGVDWRDKDVVVVGMGAFAVENVRTALDHGARHVTVVGRRHGTVCPKIIDYLNFATPYDEEFKHDKKSNMLNMIYWKKLYTLSGATQPECWMGKVKHDGHTISVSDIWFIAHFLKKLETRVGEISELTETGVVINGEDAVKADIVVNCVGFERNTSLARALSGYEETYNNNFIDENFMYLADAYIDDDAFNSLFGSSVLEMVRFHVDLYLRFFESDDFDSMLEIEGIEKIPIDERAWSHYIRAAMSLIGAYPEIAQSARSFVDRRTEAFLEQHDLEVYIAENKREWLDTHAVLAGRPMKEEECLPYVFGRLSRSR